MKECILHVQLVNRPRARGDDAKDGPDQRWFDNQTKGLIVVHAILLGEALHHPMGLVPHKRAIGVELVFVHPLASHDISTGGRGTNRQVLLLMRALYSFAIVAY